jgi:hypothetical protein
MACDVQGIVPRGSKAARFWPHFKTIRNGHIHVPTSGDWVADWIEEILAFPEGEYDDHVDCFSMMLDFMATRPRLIVPEQRGGGRCVRMTSRGVTSHVEPGGGPSTPGFIGRAVRPRLQGAPSSVNGRAILNSEPPTRVETRFGPVIITRR